jgi:hypothetical protein
LAHLSQLGRFGFSIARILRGGRFAAYASGLALRLVAVTFPSDGASGACLTAWSSRQSTAAGSYGGHRKRPVTWGHRARQPGALPYSLVISHMSNGDRCLGSGQVPGEDLAVASWVSLLKGLTPHGQ